MFKLKQIACSLIALSLAMPAEISSAFAEPQIPVSNSSGGGGGGGSVTQGTSPWIDAITTWGSVTLGNASAWGVAPTGNVPGVNADVLSLPALPAGANTIGNIGNTSFGISGTLPAFAATPTFNIGTAPTLTDNATIVGPLGATTAPASAVSAVLPDEVSACTGSNTCSATSTGTLALVDMTGYSAATVSITTDGGGNTLTFTSSDDNSIFYSAFGQSLGNLGSAPVSTTAATGGFYFTKKQRYLKIAVTTYVSGTTTITVELHQNVPTTTITSPSLVASTSAIGKTGPGFTSAQTPVTASATGTTAATTATLPAASSKTTYLCGFSIRANATAAATGNATVTNTITGTLNFTQFTAANSSGLGVTEPVIGRMCIPGNNTNTAINVISAAPGAGGVVSVSAWGYQE